jgi:hypothetical protein
MNELGAKGLAYSTRDMRPKTTGPFAATEIVVPRPPETPAQPPPRMIVKD